MMGEIKALRNSECWCVVQTLKGYLICSGSIMSCIAWLSKLNIWKRLIEAIQELICLKGVLMIEIGIYLVDPITFMDDVKSAITLANTRMKMDDQS